MSHSDKPPIFPDLLSGSESKSPADDTENSPPPPPPLPPPSVSARPAEPTEPAELKPSPYYEKLACMPEGYLLQRPEPRPYTYRLTYYFFYGTLTNPDILQGVLGLDSKPVLHPAKIYGYELAKWGQYKTLIDSKRPGTVVTGHAYLVQSVEGEYKLAYYETKAYTLKPCAIYFTDGEQEDEDPTYGQTFKYAGDAQALQESRFDWALWERQMGARLPPKWRNKGGDVSQVLGEAVVAVEKKRRVGGR